jgi:hypothetical protein
MRIDDYIIGLFEKIRTYAKPEIYTQNSKLSIKNVEVESPTEVPVMADMESMRAEVHAL